jgi:hypothetical protein
MSFESRFQNVKNRYNETFAPELQHPQLKQKISFQSSLQMMIERILGCETEDSVAFEMLVHRLYYAIPEAWRDEQFHQDIDDAISYQTVYTPVYNCGIPVKPEVMAGNTEEVEVTNWSLVFAAIIDLMERLELLIPKEKFEVQTDEQVDTLTVNR